MPELNVIRIVCDQCGGFEFKPVRWFRDHDALHCGCGRRTELDINYFKKHADDVAACFDGFQQAG